MCAGWLYVSCAVVSVIWMCPCVWGEGRFDLVVFCVWPSMSCLSSVEDWCVVFGGLGYSIKVVWCGVVWCGVVWCVGWFCVDVLSWVGGCAKCVCFVCVGRALEAWMCVCG